MPRFIDMTGRQFGKWTVLKKSSTSNNSNLQWVCRCECGKERPVVGSDLRNGKSKSCGCSLKELVKNDLTGKIFGKLHVKERTKFRNSSDKTLYKVLCDCGVSTLVTGGDLVTGKTKSCGCLIREVMDKKVRSMIGKIFGQLTVLDRDGTCFSPVRYICRCTCGTVKSVPSGSLKGGHSTSCGCRYKIGNLDDKKFGRLTVISKSKETCSKTGYSLYMCKCDCGTNKLVPGAWLLRGSAISCGCRSRGNQTHGTVYGIYDNEDNLVYIGQTVKYKLEYRLMGHIAHPVPRMKKWLNSIDYTPTIKPLISNVKVENLDMMEKALIKIVTTDYHDLLNIKYNVNKTKVA